MTDRIPECVDEAVAEITDELFQKGVLLVKLEGFPPVVEISHENSDGVLQVKGIGDGKDAWITAIRREAQKLIDAAPAPVPADPVVEAPAAPTVEEDPVTPIEGTDANGSPVVDPPTQG